MFINKYKNKFEMKLFQNDRYLLPLWVQVTQRFFETVSTQLECWYERKIQESKQQADIQAQQDRSQLIQRINSLEEELQQLRANSSSES